jgi:hypothetical protein
LANNPSNATGLQKMKRLSKPSDNMSLQSNAAETATVYSDVSFMGRDTAAFSLRLRHSGKDVRPMGSSLVESFLPDLVTTEEEKPDGEEEIKPVKTKFTAHEVAEMLDEYDGCPEDHPDCNVREERWEQIEEVLRKDTIELQGLENVLFEARVHYQMFIFQMIMNIISSWLYC